MAGESYIERTCRDIAKKNGYEVRKVKFIQCNGCPDRLFFKKARFFFVEFKAPDGKLSELQKKQIQLLRESGVEVYVIDSIEDFKNII